MNEARKFMRHIVPGITFIMLTGFYLYISNPTCFSHMLPSRDDGITTAVALVLGSGVLGYLLSIGHHLLYHWANGPWHSLAAR